jgi:radical SAM-linked protein
LRVRIKFTKNGCMKYISHLDVMRYFQKALRRAGIRTAFSSGYNPHMILSFAAPLGVSLTSDAEYFDLELTELETRSSAEMVRLLNEQMADGFRVLDIRKIPSDKGSKGMTLVAAADYDVRLQNKARSRWEEISGVPGRAEELLSGYLAEDHIPVVRRTRKGERKIDIRPLIYSLDYQEDTFQLCVSQGSTNNLRPEFVLFTFSAFAGFETEISDLLIHRKEIYANFGADGERKLVPLGELGEIIE